MTRRPRDWAQEYAVGTRFGRYVVVAHAERLRSEFQVRARCDCGTERVLLARLLGTKTTSCGCAMPALISRSRTVHGGTHTKEFATWRRMLRRCSNPRDPRFAHYGGRGIRVCDEWRISFPAFLAAVGPAPSLKHSIDRINNDGHYEPGNVRWATAIEQVRNRRVTVMVKAHGREMTAREWAAATGIAYTTICLRLRSGWTPEEAVSRAPSPLPRDQVRKAVGR